MNSLSTYRITSLLRLFFPILIFTISSVDLFAQSDHAFQLEAGVEHFFELTGSKAAAGGLFMEGKYQKGQFDVGVKAGAAFWGYGVERVAAFPSNPLFNPWNMPPINRVLIGKDYFEDMDYYAEASANYKPNFKYGKPFFGLGLRYIKRGDGGFERISATERTFETNGVGSPGYFTPLIRAGYYFRNTKYQISYCFAQRAGETDNGGSGVVYPGFFTAGASYIFGLGTKKAPPSYEIFLSEKERVFRPLLLRLELGIGHQITLSKLGIGSSLHTMLEFTIGITDKLRVGLRAERPFNHTLGVDSNSFEYYFNSDGVAYTRKVNTSDRISSYSLIATYVLKSNATKDILAVTAGLGLYKIDGTRAGSYKDNGATIELSPQIKSAKLPGLYLRVGQRFGAFSHGAFVNLIPGQVPVTFGVQAGLGLNVFRKQQKE